MRQKRVAHKARRWQPEPFGLSKKKKKTTSKRGVTTSKKRKPKDFEDELNTMRKNARDAEISQKKERRTSLRKRMKSLRDVESILYDCAEFSDERVEKLMNKLIDDFYRIADDEIEKAVFNKPSPSSPQTRDMRSDGWSDSHGYGASYVLVPLDQTRLARSMGGHYDC